MDAGRIERSLKRIAYQIAESNRKDKPVVLLGINNRGSLVAEKLRIYLSAVYSNEVKRLALLVPRNDENRPALSKAELENKFMVLVDDVIFTGKTMFEALELLSRQVGIDEVHTVVLVDRGHRKLPIEAQFVGLNLPTKLNEHVSLITEGNDILEVQLTSE